jgi:hypothetical protein
MRIFLLESLKRSGYYEDKGVDVRIILKWFFRKYFDSVKRKFIWLKVQTGGGLL